MSKNWEARQFEREFYTERLKDYKKQRLTIKKNLRLIEQEIREIEYILMGKMVGGNKQMKLKVEDFPHLFEK